MRPSANDNARSSLADECRKEIISFVETVNRLGYTKDEIADELISLASRGVDWPKASRKLWMFILDEAVTDGRLMVDGKGVVTLPDVQVVRQLGLFDAF